MRRHLLGVIGVILLATGFIILSQYGTGSSRTSMLASVCIRAGLVLGALWLALPQLLSRSPPWFIVCLVTGLLILVWRPRMAIIVLPLLAGLGILQFIRWLSKPLPAPGNRQQATRSREQARGDR